MREENRTARRDQIEQAAYDLLEQKGYGGTSMLSVARKARASNETLYNWYGDKLGLFKSLVARNAAQAQSILNDALSHDSPLAETLGAFGPALLEIVLSNRAVALNRAAAADNSGELAKALAEFGRGAVTLRLQDVFRAATASQSIPIPDPAEAVDIYLTLLVGDLQIRRIITREDRLSTAEIQERANMALTRMMLILAAENGRELLR